MNNLTKKQAIVQSLEAMSATETEKLLNYIKGMHGHESVDQNYLSFKQQAMKEIQGALQGEKEIIA